MKKFLIIFFSAISFFPLVTTAQINNVIVEKYYIADANDATDTTDGRSLEEGSITYRVYLQIEPGSRVKKIYGDSKHAFKILSTANFYNNINRSTVGYFGYNINKSWFSSNPTIALDSWLTLGLATTTLSGILKSSDTNGCISQITSNSGGTAGIAGGLLMNNDSTAGVPLSTEDGLAPYNPAILGTWSYSGFRDNFNSGPDTTVFGSEITGSQFISDTAYLQQNTGVVGAGADSNKVLVAQLTTKGEISFELNVVMTEPDGSSTHDVQYVAKLADGETNGTTLKVSPFLTYPRACGCTDPNYLEYSSSYSCSASDSCRTHIVYGCMDVNACNYDPNANFNIQSLCCYPGSCSDRDIAVVCPSLSNSAFRIFPNPAERTMSLEIPADNDKEVHYEIYNAFGKRVGGKNINVRSGTFDIDVSGLQSGVYMFRLYKGSNIESKTFMKD